MRRVFLDLAGRIPSVGEARAFLDDADPAKRCNLVDHLLARATFPAHVGRTLSDLMLPGAKSNLMVRGQVPFFEDWLRMRLSADTPYAATPPARRSARTTTVLVFLRLRRKIWMWRRSTSSKTPGGAGKAVISSPNRAARNRPSRGMARVGRPTAA
jgi:hypothetical protein